MVIAEVAGQKYYVDKSVNRKWERIKDGALVKSDDDKVYVVDGRERSGKSVWTMQQAGAIDPTLFEEALATKKLDRICFTGEETLRAIRQTKSTKAQTKVVIFDEAFRGLASSSVLSKTNRLIVQALMEMGQNNLVLFIVLPSYFLLDRYPAVLRSNALFHITKPKNKHGARKFYVYNYQKKAYLYHLGIKKGWGYPVHTNEHGSFFNKYPGGKEFEELYRKKKLEAFKEIEGKLQGEADESRYVLQRDHALYLLMEQKTNPKKWSQLSLSDNFKEAGFQISPATISTRVKGVKKKLAKLKTS